MSARTAVKDVVVFALLTSAVLATYQYNKPVYRVTRLVDSTKTEQNVVKRAEIWKRAVDEAEYGNKYSGAQFTPKISFNLAFQLAAHQIELNDLAEAEQTLLRALEALPENMDLHTLEPNTRRRVSVALDHLAQFHQERKEYVKAMEYYDRALDAIASPKQIRRLFLAEKVKSDEEEAPPPSRDHLQSLAGTLNNLSTLYMDLDREEDARAMQQMSEQVLAFAATTATMGKDPVDENK